MSKPKRRAVSVKLEDIRYISNILSIVRIFLVLPIIYFIISRHFIVALSIAVVAMLSDLFDGYFARKLNQISDLGKILDPIADKLLISGIFISLLIAERQYQLPLWAIIFIIFRDFLVLIGNSYLMLRTKIIISSSNPSRAATAFICLTIASYILLTGYSTFFTIPFIFLLSLAIIFSIASAIGYGREMRSILIEKRKMGKGQRKQEGN